MFKGRGHRTDYFSTFRTRCPLYVHQSAVQHAVSVSALFSCHHEPPAAVPPSCWDTLVVRLDGGTCFSSSLIAPQSYTAHSWAHSVKHLRPVTLGAGQRSRHLRLHESSHDEGATPDKSSDVDRLSTVTTVAQAGPL